MREICLLVLVQSAWSEEVCSFVPELAIPHPAISCSIPDPVPSRPLFGNCCAYPTITTGAIHVQHCLVELVRNFQFHRKSSNTAENVYSIQLFFEENIT
jgi:hypothetical protein